MTHIEIGRKVHSFSTLVDQAHTAQPKHLLYGSGLNSALGLALNWDAITGTLEHGAGDPEQDAAIAGFQGSSGEGSDIIQDVEDAIDQDRKARENLNDMGERLLVQQGKVLDSPINIPDGLCEFLHHFNSLFTTNMDLLWIAFRDQCSLSQLFPPTFIHGAAHWLVETSRFPPNAPLDWSQLSRDQFHEVSHEGSIHGTYRRTIDQAESMDGEWSPAAVFRSTPDEKREAIETLSDTRDGNNPISELSSASGVVATFGWGMAAQDSHILNALLRGDDIQELWIGLYDPGPGPVDPNEIFGTVVCQTALSERESPIKIQFFCTDTAIGNPCTEHG